MLRLYEAPRYSQRRNILRLYAMVHTEFLIIGQGISGTWLSWWLQKEGKDFRVIDDYDPSASSRVAAGVINPVTGRRHVTTWMAETLLPFAKNSYSELGDELGLEIFAPKKLIELFPTAQMRLAFLERVNENPYLRLPEKETSFSQFLEFDLGYGEISPVYTVYLQTLLKAWREKLEEMDRLMNEKFEGKQLQVTDNGIQYKELSAETVIFCDGVKNQDLPWFNKIPFALNKGEALVVEIPDLPPDAIYKKGMVIVPLENPSIFWAGASYQWEYDHAYPTEDFRRQGENFLRNTLKIPFKIIDHLAAIRPASLERRPFVGLHPQFPRVGILNGMGTKGCSLAPFFAKQLVDRLIRQSPIEPLADVKRFTKILSTF